MGWIMRDADAGESADYVIGDGERRLFVMRLSGKWDWAEPNEARRH